MRAAIACQVVACLALVSGTVYGQGDPAETPSLLPLPTFSPPPLPRTAGQPVALQARAPMPRPQGNIYSPVAFDAELAPTLAPGAGGWESPTEVAPGPAMVESLPASVMPASGMPGNPTPGYVMPADNSTGSALPGGVMPGYGPGPGCSSCGGCGGYGTCGGGNGCCLLNGSPYLQAMNTSGMPPLNLAGMQFMPGYWFGSLSGLVMTRDLPNGLSTTFNSSNVNTNLMDTSQAHGNWAGGGQVMFGRWFGPQAYGVQFVYWGVGPMTGNASVVDPNYQLSTPFNLGNVNIGNQSPTFYFDNAHEHALWRKDGFNNFEWNGLRRLPLGCRMMFTGIAGIRYFRFQDGLLFGGVNSNNFSDAGGAFAAYLNTGMTNSLTGFQLGTRIDYFVLPRVRLYAQPMMGIFGNQVSMREHLYSGDGLQGFDVFARRTTASTLGQIDVGAGYQITPRFSAFAAYRLMGVTRVGLADNQIPAFWADQQGMQHIKTNGDLILHGVMIGGMWNF